MSVQITAIPIFNDNYIWVIYNTQLQEAVAVDPGLAQPLLDFLSEKNLKLSAVLITHHHLDHVGGLADLLTHSPDLTIYGPDTPKIDQITHTVTQNDTVNLTQLGVELLVIHTPGHTLDHVCYFAKTGPWLFCGDTLFSAGCGRLFEGTPAQMYHSMGKLLALPEKTLVFCTHEYTLANLTFAQKAEPNNQAIQDHIKKVRDLRANNLPSVPTSLALEKAINPFLRADLPEAGEAVANGHTPPKLGVETFTALRAWKDVS